MSLGSDAEELVGEPKVPIPEVSRFQRRDWTLIPILITLTCVDGREDGVNIYRGSPVASPVLDSLYGFCF